MGAEAKLYLQEHSIPQLFEGLMTGLIYNRPSNPLGFLEEAISSIRANPEKQLAWDMFIDKGDTEQRKELTSKRLAKQNNGKTKSEETKKKKTKEKSAEPKVEMHSREQSRQASRGLQRQPSVMRAAEVAVIPAVPIVLFMGGPGGGKTRHAARVHDSLADKGLVHICMPDIIRNALNKYKDKYSEWKEANDHYMRGELIPNQLALALVKAEMGRHKDASAYFLEGFPREARQVEDFERQVAPVNMAMILDYDERTLRDHMERRGLGIEIIDQKIKEFKQKTLPSAKYFDDQKLLHLIPGEKDDPVILERMKKLVVRAMESGVAVINSQPPSQAQHYSPAPPVQSPSAPPVQTPPTAPVATPPVQPLQTPPAPTPPSPPRHEETEERQTPKEQVATAPTTSQEDRLPPLVTPEPEQKVPSTPAASELPPIDLNHNSRPPSNKSKTSAQNSVESRTSSVKKGSAGSDRKVPTPPNNTEEIALPSVSVQPPSTLPSAAGRASAASNKEPEIPRGLPNNAPVVLIVGAPGSRKSEIAKKVAQKYDGFVLLSMGDLLRRKVRESPDELWKKVGEKMDNGESAPMKLCRELLYTEMNNIGQTSWGYVIEGFPRDQLQMEDLQNTIERLDLAVLIDCTEQYCEQMIQRRREEGESRSDDAPEIFKQRLLAFKNNTLPMLKHLDDLEKLRVVRGDKNSKVDGDSDLDTVFKEVSAAIDSTLFIEEDDGSGHSLDESKKGSLNDSQTQPQQ